MPAVKIIMHAVRMVLTNLSDALRIAIVLVLAGHVITSVGMYYMLGTVTPPTFDAELFTSDAQLNIFPFLLSMIVSFVLSAWVIVAWHRFVLLEEYPSAAVPKLHGQILVTYILKTLAIGLLLIFAALLLAILASVFVMAGGAAGTLFAMAAMILVMTYLSLRISLILPAAAIGENMSISNSWTATAPLSGQLFLLATIILALSVISQSVIGIFSSVWVLREIATIAVNLLTVLVGASVLTTLYGHLIQKRALS